LPKDKKKRLLITTDSFLPRWDGIARFLTEIIPKLSEKYQITVVAPKFPGRAPSFKGVKIVRIPLSFWQFGDYKPARLCFGDVAGLVKSSDLVFNQTIGPIGMAGIRYAKKYKKPVVSYIHSIEWELFSESVDKFRGIIQYITKKVARKLYNKCNLLLVPSKGVIDILDANKIKTRKTVVRLGTDIARFIPPIDKNRAKRKVKINPRYFVVGFCGRIGREKDIPTLHKAFKIIGRKRTDIFLVIVGKGLEKEEEKLIKGKHVMLTGAKDNVVPYLQAMDVYVLPSLTETTSLSTLEAMSCGLPVVVTRVGYIKKYIKNMTNGVFFSKGNAEDLAEKLEYLLNGPDEMRRIGEAGRKTIVKRFNWHNTIKGIEDSLDEVVDWVMAGTE
jgi:glycosyltransferase involved in cell wall biosynthesis